VEADHRSGGIRSTVRAATLAAFVSSAATAYRRLTTRPRSPDLDGIAATRELASVAPEVRVLILTTFEQDDYVFGALRAGASGGTHVKRILMKLGLRDRVQAVIFAYESGMNRSPR